MKLALVMKLTQMMIPTLTVRMPLLTTIKKLLLTKVQDVPFPALTSSWNRSRAVRTSHSVSATWTLLSKLCRRSMKMIHNSILSALKSRLTSDDNFSLRSKNKLSTSKVLMDSIIRLSPMTLLECRQETSSSSHSRSLPSSPLRPSTWTKTLWTSACRLSTDLRWCRTIFSTLSLRLRKDLSASPTSVPSKI